MEVFFYEFLNFFPQAEKPVCREEDQTEEQRRPVGRQAQEEADRRAQEEEVERPAGGQAPEAQIQQAA